MAKANYKRSEQEAMSDPDFALEVALGPANSNLVPQDRSKGIHFKKMFKDQPKRLLFKNAHLSRDDYRCYDAENGKLVLNAHHPGKDPFESIDPLELGHNSQPHRPPPGRNNYHNNYNRNNYRVNMMPTGEWSAHCDVTGRNGFPSMKIRPKTFSRHGRQIISDTNGNAILNVCKQSKFKTMSIRQGFEVSQGESGDVVYTIKCDLAARTMVVYNEDDEEVMFVQKSMKTLILNAAIGAGSETLCDIAPGVDITVMAAILFGVKQVGEHYLKDAVDNYVMEPAKDAAVDEATGFIETQFGDLGKMAVHIAKKGSRQAVIMAREYGKFHQMFYS